MGLMACGGGGAGESQPPPSPIQPPAPGSTEARLTEDNADRAVAGVLFATDSVMSGGRSVVREIEKLLPGHVDSSTFDCRNRTVLVRHLDLDGNAAVSVNDMVRVQTTDCQGVVEDSEIEITDIESSEGRVGHLAGELSVDVESGSSSASGTASFEVMFQQSSTQWTFSEIDVESTVEGTTFGITSDRLGNETAENSYAVDFRGDVHAEGAGLRGSYRFRTRDSLEGKESEFPTRGEIYLTAADSGVQVTPAADPGLRTDHADYRVDPDGSAEYGDASSVLWRSWLLGALFGYPNTRPIIDSLHIQPAEPLTTDILDAVYAVRDLDGDFVYLEFEWSRDGERLGSSSSLGFESTRKDDVIELRVTASDKHDEDGTSANASTTIGNSPPVISSLSIGPLSPTTADDLMAVMSVAHPDDEPLVHTYEWQINGTPTEHTGSSLPAGEHRKGDTVDLVVSVSDGESSDEAEATAEILDAPVRVVTPLPESVRYGDEVSFNASVEDPDGDPVGPVDFQLVHGPAGMEVDSRTGVVTWRATGPRFGKSMEYAWSLSLGEGDKLPLSGVISVQSSEDNVLIARTGMPFPWHDGLSVSDVNGDGADQVLVAAGSSLSELGWNGSDLVQVWMYPFPVGDSTVFETVTTGDADGDGRREVFFNAAGKIFRLDGVRREIVASTSEFVGSCDQLEFADLARDGSYELVCLGPWQDRRLTILAADDLGVIRELEESSEHPVVVAIGNVDADAALEIVRSDGLVYDGASYAREWRHAPTFGTRVEVGDIVGDGTAEIVGTSSSGIKVFDARRQEVLSEHPVHLGLGHAFLIADIDGDSGNEIVTVSSDNDLSVYRGEGSGVSIVAEHQLPTFSGDAKTLTLGDVDRDGSKELVWVADFGGIMFVADAASAATSDVVVEWTSENSQRFRGSFVGGGLARYGGGSERLIFLADGEVGDTHLVSMDGEGRLSVTDGFYRGFALDISDYDLDDDDEVLLSYSSGDYWGAFDLSQGRFEWSKRASDDATSYSIVTADVNGDGRDDLVSMSGTGGGVVVACL